MAKSPFNLGIFNGPSYSGFSIKHGNRVSTKPGVIKPVWCEYLDTGERLKDLDLGALVRQAPMLAPTLDTYEITVDAFAVRLRTLGMAGRNPWQYEDFFNYNKNIDGSYRLPSFYLGRMWSANNPLKLGTLYESLNYPSMKWLREMILEAARNFGWVFNPVVVASEATNPFNGVFVGPSNYPYSSQQSVQEFVLSGFPGNPKFTFSSLMTASGLRVYDSVFPSLVRFCFERYPRSFRPYRSISKYSDVEEDYNWGGYFIGVTFEGWEPYNVLDEIYKLYHVDAESVLSEFVDYLMDFVLALVAKDSNVYNASFSQGSGSYITLTGSSYGVNTLFSFVSAWMFKSLEDVPYLNSAGYDDGIFSSALTKTAVTSGAFSSFGWPDGEYSEFADRLLPDYFINSYWKIISDWYINTAIFEPDSFYLDHYMHRNPNTGATDDYYKVSNTLFFRYWKNDYFTSAFPNSQLGSAVGIPVNGTIIDFRNANSWQKFKERLLYAGSRFRDVLFAVTGKRTSSAIMDMSEPLGRWKGVVNVDSVLQTSQSTSSSPQAAYAGSGLSYKLDGKSVSYTAEEPTVIMVVLNINPVAAAYFDGLPRKFVRSNLYQYDVPQLANVGEQQVYNYELFLGPDSRFASAGYSPIFGWQRRYGDFMWFPDEVHGDFRGDMDYWHNARTFTNAPRLNEQFLQVRPDEDNLNRVFAVSSPVVDKFYCHVFFGGHIIRHLPKHAYYDL